MGDTLLGEVFVMLAVEIGFSSFFIQEAKRDNRKIKRTDRRRYRKGLCKDMIVGLG